MQIFRRKSIDNNTFFAIPRNSLKIPCKFLARSDFYLYLWSKPFVHAEHSAWCGDAKTEYGGSPSTCFLALCGG
jgi:hypothetical protein